MAKIIQPEVVIRFDPNDRWNREFNRGFRWHLISRTKTACGEILEERPTETKLFSDVGIKDLCGICFRGLRVTDE